MTKSQRIIKYIAVILALLIVSGIVGGAVWGISLLGKVTAWTSNDKGKIEQIENIDEIKKLHIEVIYANVVIKQGEKLSCETDNEYINIKERMGTYIVEEKRHSLLKGEVNTDVVITVPSDLLFQKIDIETGAGTFTADVITTQKLSLSIGAGAMKIDNLIALKKAEINGGAGKITVLHGTVQDMDFNIGIGKVDFTATVLGESEFNGGAGEVDLTLLGGEELYELDIDKGLGDAEIKGDLIDKSETYGNGTNEIEINGGIGSIKVDFSDDI